MSNNFNTAITNATKNEWLTPPRIIRALGEFDLDPCAPINRPWEMAKQHFTINDNGLTKPWGGRVWLNPPYGGETFMWMKRMAEHKKGIALIFARTETKGFHDEIWEKAHALFFFKGRLRFYHVDGKQGGTANAPSCLVSYNKDDTWRIEVADMVGDITGKLVIL